MGSEGHRILVPVRVGSCTPHPHPGRSPWDHPQHCYLLGQGQDCPGLDDDHLLIIGQTLQTEETLLGGFPDRGRTPVEMTVGGQDVWWDTQWMPVG